MARARLMSTQAALAAIHRLQAVHGPLVFFQSGGCCDGSLPICLERGELSPGAGDVLLGAPAGMPFYVDSELYGRWGAPDLVLDLGDGPAEGFSLSPADAHFITRSPRPEDR